MGVGKIAAGILIFAASLLLARGLRDNIHKKRQFLQEFISFIEFAQGEIDFYNRESDEIVSKYLSQNGKTVFTEALLNGVRGERKRDPHEYLGELKKLDKAAQKNYSHSLAESLKKELDASEKSDGQKASLAGKIIPLFGIAVFILLL